MKKIIIIGSGGHAISCVEILNNSKDVYKIIGYIDQKKNNKFPIKYLQNMNCLQDFKKLQKITKNFALCIGQIKNSKLRESIYLKFKKMGCSFPVIKSKYSLISKNAVIGPGSMVFHNVIINMNVKIGENTILNSGIIIEHGVDIGNNCHISTGAIINGDSKIGNNCFIGSGTIVHQGIKIGNNCIIGAGKIISKNVSSKAILR